jgi:hypothetical protein
MPLTSISPGPVWNILQGVEYALINAPCRITAGVLVQRSNTLGGAYSDWVGSTGAILNPKGGFIKCVTGNTTIKAVKLKMKEL